MTIQTVGSRPGVVTHAATPTRELAARRDVSSPDTRAASQRPTSRGLELRSELHVVLAMLVMLAVIAVWALCLAGGVSCRAI